MKTTAKIFAMIFLLSIGTWLMPQKAQAYVGISFQVFYDDLSPYGTWVDSPDYGYVWVPGAGGDFTPYATGGHWVYTVYGWTWVSDYPWGWAPFHYGRWYWDNWYGWVWVPGTEWGPAWVTWRVCNGYYGWAPLAPGFAFTMYWERNLYIPAGHWIFVPDRDFCSRDVYRHHVDFRDNDRLYRNSRVISRVETDQNRNVRYFAGPEPREVGKITGREIRPVDVRDNTRPGTAYRDGKLEMYRPEVKATANNSRRPAPEKYTSYNDRSSKPVNKNNFTNERSSSPKNEPVIRNDRNTEKKPTPVMRNEGNNERKPAPVMRNEGNNERKPAPVMRNGGNNERNTKVESGQGAKYSRPPANNQMQERRAPQQNPGKSNTGYQSRPVEKSNMNQNRGAQPQRHAQPAPSERKSSEGNGHRK